MLCTVYSAPYSSDCFFDKLKAYCKRQRQTAVTKLTMKLRKMSSEFLDCSAKCDRGRTAVMFLFNMHLNILLKAMSNCNGRSTNLTHYPKNLDTVLPLY